MEPRRRRFDFDRPATAGAEPVKSGVSAKRDTRFKKGQSGNPRGKPTGSRHRAALAAQVLLDGEAQALTRKAVELALKGDITALRLCLERIVPPRRDRPVAFPMPAIGGANDAVALMAALLAAVASGSVTPCEASEVTKVIEGYVEALKASEFETRLLALEGAMGGNDVAR